MARNSEKAMTTLARWRASQVGVIKEKDRRPYLASDCEDIHEAEKWRRQIIGEISRKVAQIQNGQLRLDVVEVTCIKAIGTAGLGEFKLRDLNDEINKLLREKGHWEDRIKDLGGPDYRKTGPKMLDADGKEVPGNKGYKYFGAAKDLPGVRELFEQEPPPPPRKTRAELMKDIDADYYGYRDEDDGIITPLEMEEERKVIIAKVRAWKEKQNKLETGQIENEESSHVDEANAMEEGEDEEEVMSRVQGTLSLEWENTHFTAHVPVPSQKQIEEALLHRKKMELIHRYTREGSEEEEESETAEMSET